MILVEYVSGNRVPITRFYKSTFALYLTNLLITILTKCGGYYHEFLASEGCLGGIPLEVPYLIYTRLLV